MACLQLANQMSLFFSSTTQCELTFKMAAEEVSEDSVQIIDNKKRRNRAVANASFPDAVKSGAILVERNIS